MKGVLKDWREKFRCPFVFPRLNTFATSFSPLFVPFLTFLCFLPGMITGAAGATVYYSLKLRHPLLDLPIIDYDLALLFQPMLLLGISIGVVLNVLFAEWMVTILLIILFLGNCFQAAILSILSQYIF